jgi:hypothetical protein
MNTFGGFDCDDCKQNPQLITDMVQGNAQTLLDTVNGIHNDVTVNIGQVDAKLVLVLNHANRTVKGNCTKNRRQLDSLNQAIYDHINTSQAENTASLNYVTNAASGLPTTDVSTEPTSDTVCEDEEDEEEEEQPPNLTTQAQRNPVAQDSQTQLFDIASQLKPDVVGPPVDLSSPHAVKFWPKDKSWWPLAVAFEGQWLADYMNATDAASWIDQTSRAENPPGETETFDLTEY